MLNLMDALEVEGIVILRDDEDPRKFYLLPDQPVIPLDDRGIPEFLFIKYIKDVERLNANEAAGGGYVQFRSVLTTPADLRQRVLAALEARLRDEKAAGKKPFGQPISATTPLLAAPLWTSGKVSLATFKVADTGLVQHATESAPCDLGGHLGASFALQLSDEGAEIFWSAFKGYQEQKVPILVTYELTYKARVSAHLTIDATHRAIRSKLIQKARPYRLLTAPFVRYVPVAIDAPFTLAQLPALRAKLGAPVLAMVDRGAVDKAISEASASNDITVHIESGIGGAGPDAQKAQDMLFKIATDVLADRIIPALFGTGPAQPGSSTDTQTKPDQSLYQLHDDATDTDQQHFHLELGHDSAIDRQVNPNGSIFLQIDDPQQLATCFRELRLTDGFFSLGRVTALTSGVSFERDGIALIQVYLSYDEIDEADPGQPRIQRSTDGVLKAETDTFHWQFDRARRADGSHKKEYIYFTEVTYREAVPRTRSKPVRCADPYLTITAQALGAVRVELVLTAGKDVVDSAVVALRYTTADGTEYAASIELTRDKPTRTWFQYIGLDPQGPGAGLVKPSYEQQTTYRIAGNQLTMDPVTTNAATLEIASPFHKTLGFVIRPQGSWDGVASISGDLTYDDPAHDYRIVKSFSLDKPTASLAIDVPILEGGPETASYTARVNRSDGSALALPPGHGGPGTLWIGPQVGRIFSVQVLPDLLDFDQDIKLAVVHLEYREADGTNFQDRTVVFSKAARQAQEWRIQQVDPTHNVYDYTIKLIGLKPGGNLEIRKTGCTDPVLLVDRSLAGSPGPG